jgi:hypothetical protein
MRFDNIFYFGDCSTKVYKKVVGHLNVLAKLLKDVNKTTKKNHKLYIFIYYSGHGVLSLDIDKNGDFKRDENGNLILSLYKTYAVCPSDDGFTAEYFSLE